MTTPKTCTIVVGVEKTGRHIITRCGKPATHNVSGTQRRLCAEHAEEHVKRYGRQGYGAYGLTKIKTKASKCE